MKKFIITSILLTFFMVTIPVMAQEETLLKNGIYHTGGHGGPVSKLTSFNGELGLMTGGRGVWTINHAFSIGGGGYGLSTDIDAPMSDRNMNVQYGGVILEYNAFPNRLIHFSANTMIGAGEVNYRYIDNYYDDRYGSDKFSVVEPGLNLELNVVKFFHIGFGVSYRFVDGIELKGLRNNNMSGISANVILKFGDF